MSSHKRDFNSKVLISEIEENHAHEHVWSMQGLYVGPTPVIFANLISILIKTLHNSLNNYLRLN